MKFWTKETLEYLSEKKICMAASAQTAADFSRDQSGFR